MLLGSSSINIKANKNTWLMNRATCNFKEIKTIQDLVAAVAVGELRRMPGHCEGSFTCPTVSVRTSFKILLVLSCA